MEFWAVPDAHSRAGSHLYVIVAHGSDQFSSLGERDGVLTRVSACGHIHQAERQRFRSQGPIFRYRVRRTARLRILTHSQDERVGPAIDAVVQLVGGASKRPAHLNGYSLPGRNLTSPTVSYLGCTPGHAGLPRRLPYRRATRARKDYPEPKLFLYADLAKLARTRFVTHIRPGPSLPRVLPGRPVHSERPSRPPGLPVPPRAIVSVGTASSPGQRPRICRRRPRPSDGRWIPRSRCQCHTQAAAPDQRRSDCASSRDCML